MTATAAFRCFPYAHRTMEEIMRREEFIAKKLTDAGWEPKRIETFLERKRAEGTI